jgi:hypothetical protein
MLRSLGKTLVLTLLTIAGGIAMFAYLRHDSTAAKLVEVERRNVQLQQFVDRLSDERRIAHVMVTGTNVGENGTTYTTLLFVEYTRTGRELPARQFTIEGNRAHIDALVVKFDRDFVKENDPLRGKSIVLFQRIFGEHQAPQDAFPIDTPGAIPSIYADPNPTASGFEQELWGQFWQLTTDAELREKKGVRVADGESVWGPFEPGRLYTISVDAAGGMSMTNEPLGEGKLPADARQPLPRQTR